MESNFKILMLLFVAFTWLSISSVLASDWSAWREPSHNIHERSAPFQSKSFDWTQGRQVLHYIHKRSALSNYRSSLSSSSSSSFSEFSHLSESKPLVRSVRSLPSAPSSSSSSSSSDNQAAKFMSTGNQDNTISDPATPTHDEGVCTVKGRVYTHRQWYGYLVHKAFQQGLAKVRYQITYPVRECCANLLIYYDEQVKELNSDMTCEQRRNVLPVDNNQVIPLTHSNGCVFWNETGEAFYVCRGERMFKSRLPRTWFFAVSRCNQTGPLNLNYVFNITGFSGACEEDPLAPSSGWNEYVGYLHMQDEQNKVYRNVAIALGVVAGLGLILAASFFALWFLNLRNTAKGKGSSVTSSQATMTQDDIFYVNPSLSDQSGGNCSAVVGVGGPNGIPGNPVGGGGHQEYSQSGSENYYEVIPERRSYESINAGLANGSISGLHLRPIRSLHGHPNASIHHHGHPHHHPLHPIPPHHPAAAGTAFSHPHHHMSLHHPHPNAPPTHHPHHAGSMSLSPLNPHPATMIGAQNANPNPNGLHHSLGRPNGNQQLKDLNGAPIHGNNQIRGVTYLFEDYPPPPYQPPKFGKLTSASSAANNNNPNPNIMSTNSMGVNAPASSSGIALSIGNAGNHQHSISLPAKHWQRPNQNAGTLLSHQPYHTTNLVPNSPPISLSNGYTDTSDPDRDIDSNNMMTTDKSLGNHNNNTLMGNDIGPMSSSGASVGMSSSGIMSGTGSSLMVPMSSNGQAISLGTFGVGVSSNSGAGLNNSTPLSNMGGVSMSLKPTHSSSQVPPPAPISGQCETSA